ncbi:hypothetical protein PR048_015099 [Dryococelus australis]|uniref:Uncharacterized protein n=1 Tax=Dryococelus australis TaxID=614101 RepID=A0ABQ9HG18_9NEOP|nr:hypothetical protein PR048_015099 [Dryococelus australis]
MIVCSTDKVILCGQNISLEYVADPTAKFQVPETKSASTQTSYFRSSMIVECAEDKISSCNKFCAESKVDSDIQEASVKSTSNQHIDVIVFNDSSKCDYKEFLSELKSVLRHREETGSMKVPGHFDAGGSDKSKKNVHDALLLSASSNINVTNKSLEASSKRIGDMSNDIFFGDSQCFEKNCSVLRYCNDKVSVSLAKEETYSAELQDAKTEEDNCMCASLSKCMTDDLSEGSACENGTNYKSVKDAAYLTSVDMFSSLSIEDDRGVVKSTCSLNHASHVSDLINSDEDGSHMSYPRTCSQLSLVNTLEQVPRFSVESCKSLVPFCEEYKYTDDEGVVLTEKIFLVQHGR